MSKSILILVIFLFINQCSFNKNSKFWNPVKLKQDDNKKEIFKEIAISNFEINTDLEINIKNAIFSKNSFQNNLTNNNGRLRYDGKFTSIKKTDEEDPLTISLDRSMELIKIKIQADKDRLIANFEGDPLVQVLNGRYGPFIQVTPTKGKKINVKIPKGTEPKSLTREKCLTLMENQPAKKARGKK